MTCGGWWRSSLDEDSVMRDSQGLIPDCKNTKSFGPSTCLRSWRLNSWQMPSLKSFLCGYKIKINGKCLLRYLKIAKSIGKLSCLWSYLTARAKMSTKEVSNSKRQGRMCKLSTTRKSENLAWTKYQAALNEVAGDIVRSRKPLKSGPRPVLHNLSHTHTQILSCPLCLDVPKVNFGQITLSIAIIKQLSIWWDHSIVYIRSTSMHYFKIVWSKEATDPWQDKSSSQSNPESPSQ